MASLPVVTCEELAQHLDDPAWVIFDTRYELADKERGLREYGKAHVPGAYYAHLDRDLSGPVGTGGRGRHPLPIPAAFQRFLGSHGITPSTMVVAYDDAAGQWASRLWWLLRHYGHRQVAVLDGGLTRWKALKLPLRGTHEKARPTVSFAGQPGHMPTLEVAPLMERLGLSPAAPLAFGATPTQQSHPDLVLLDARAPERFRGEVEPVDKRAGHIPSARNAPFALNVGPDHRFLPQAALREHYLALGVPPQEAQGAPMSANPTGQAGPGAASAMALAGGGGPGPSRSELARTLTKEERRGAALTAPPRSGPAQGPPPHPAPRVACYCGSGATATLDILAMELAGLGTAALYPGSWSEWSWPDAGRPIQTGPA